MLVLAPGLTQHLCLESVQHGCRSVYGLLNDGPVNEVCECVMCILIPVVLSARRFVVIELLDGGVKPPRGHARLGE